MKRLVGITIAALMFIAGTPGHASAADGAPVAGFGLNGVLTDPVVPGAHVFVADVVDDDDGRLVVAGSYNLPGELDFSDHWFVARYLRNGTRDPSFATGGFLELPNPSHDQVLVHGLATFPDRSIVVGGTCVNCVGLVHIRSDGSGLVAVGSRPSVSAVAELPDRRIAVVGNVGPTRTRAVMAILPSGAIDTTFGGQMAGLLLEGGSVLSTHSGLLLSAVVTRPPDQHLTCALVKFDSAGNLDPGFAGTGQLEVATEIGNGPFMCQGVALPDGRTLVVTTLASGNAASLVDSAGGTHPAPWPVPVFDPNLAAPLLPTLLADGVGRILMFTFGQSTISAVHLDQSVDGSFGQAGSTQFPGEIDRARVLETGDVVVWGGSPTMSLLSPRPMVLQLLSLPTGVAPQPPVLPTTKFVPLSPKRILDTRQGLGAPPGKVPGTGHIDVQISGNGGVPTSGAVAVVLNVTATETTGPGFITVYPTGATRPVVSNLNVEHVGQTVPNLVTVRLGDGGKISLFAQTTTDLVADVAGYYIESSATSDGRFLGINPRRILDTRVGIGAPAALVPQGGRITLQVRGVAPVPATGVSAVVLNVTATEAVQPGFVTVWPGDGDLPVVSNLNIVGGETRPNLVIVPLAPDGSIALFTSGGTHLIADLAGWFTDASAPSSNDGLFVPLDQPTRILDTRQHSTTPYPLANRWEIQTAGTATMPPHGVGAVAINATTTETLAPGFVTLWPASSEQPLVSNLNATHGQQTVPNAAIVTIGANRLAAYTTAGGHLIIDITGWYSNGQ